MPDFIISSPDGQKFKITAPEGATADQLPDFSGARPKQPLPASMQHPQDMTAVERFGTGFMDPFYGAQELEAQTLKMMDPAGAEANTKAVQERQRDIRQRTEGGFDPVRAAGSAVNPINLMGAGAAARAGSRVLGGIAGGAVGGMTQPTTGQDFETEKLEQAGLGAATGGALGALPRVITPFPRSPQRQAAVGALQREGIEPTAGQQSGRKSLRYAEGHLGEMPGAGGATEAANERVGEQFTAAALRRAGINANRATADTVDQGFRDNSNRFNALAGQTDMRFDRQLNQDLGTLHNDYVSQTQPSQRRPYIENTINDIRNTVATNNGVLDGRTYQQMRSRIARFERETSDNDYRRALGGIRMAMDDAMERSIAQTNPRLLGEWRDVRNQFRNLLVIEKASTGAGEGAASGLLSPAKIRAAIVAQDRRDYARGRGDYAELARSGEEVLSPLPQSGTAPRAAVGSLATAIGAGAGGAAGGIPGAVGGALAPGAAGRALMSPPVQAYLKNQATQRMPGLAGVGPALAPAGGAAVAQPGDALAPPQDALSP